MAIEDDWISVDEAAKLAGCSPQYIRRDLLAHLPDKQATRTVGGRLDGWLANGKAWLVTRASAVALRETLSTRATLHADARKSRQAAAGSRNRPAKRAAQKKKAR